MNEVLLDFLRVVCPYLFWVGVAFLAWDGYKLIRAIRRGERLNAYDIALELVSHLYFVGVTAKFGLVGPDFLRWHVGDIGFPVAIMLLLTLSQNPRTKRWYYEASTEEQLKERLVFNYIRKVFLGIALGLSVAYEVFAGWLTTTLVEQGQSGTGIGGFDWIDVGAYSLGAATGFVLLHFTGKRLEYCIEIVREDAKQVVAAKRSSPTQTTAPAYKRKKRRVKRGVR